MGRFTDFCLMLNNYGISLAYTTLLKSIIPHALNISGVDNSIATNEVLWGFLVTVFAIYPLAFF